MIYDPPRGRILMFGGRAGVPQNDVWSLSLVGSPRWTRLQIAGIPPAPREDPAVFYDPLRDRMIVAGRNSRPPLPLDVWALDLSGEPTWEQLLPEGAPPSPRYGQSFILDVRRNRLVMWGGSQYFDAPPHGFYQNYDDLWELTLGSPVAWRKLSPLGPRPPARAFHTAVYDQAEDRVLIFSGFADRTLEPPYMGQSFRDVWQLELSGGTRWSQVHPSGALPAGRVGHTAVYDPHRQQMIILGGTGIDAERGIYWTVNDVWSLSLSAGAVWREVPTLGTMPYVLPGHTTILDPVMDRIVVTAGTHSTALSLRDEPAAWTVLSPPGAVPPIWYGHDSIYDPVAGRMISFGGYNGGVLRDYAYLNGVWSLSMEEGAWWEAVASSGTPPAGRYAHSCIHDPLRRRMIVFGGSDDIVHFNDTWSLALVGPPAWTRLDTDGEPPPARRGHTAIYDPDGDRMIVFGGQTGPRYEDFLNDVWTLSLGGRPRWVRLEPSGTRPRERSEAVAIYDPRRKRMIVHGGAKEVGTRDDVWVLTLDGPPAWSEENVGGARPVGTGHAAIYDPDRDRMVIQFDRTADALSLGEPMTWTHLLPQDDAPPSMWMHSGIYDHVNDQAVFFNGNGAWALRWDRPLEPVEIDFEPGSVENVVNPEARGRNRIAILGSARFDAEMVDPATIHAPGVRARDDERDGRGPGHARDLNRDGFTDVVVWMRSADLNLLPGDTTVVLEGETRTGRRFRGSDHVRWLARSCRSAAGSPRSPDGADVGPALESNRSLAVRSGPSGLELTAWIDGSGPAVLELFDVAGRRRRCQRLDDVGPGWAVAPIGSARDLGPGVYLVRLTQGRRLHKGKIVILD